MANVNGLFEDELDADGMPVISEFGKRFADVTKDAMVEAVRDQVDERIDDRHDELVETIDAYMDLVNENVDDSVAELRKLMLLAVASIGGPDKAREFVKRVGELARAGSLSSATGAWAQGSRNDSAENRQTVAGGSGTLRKESVEREEAAEIFEEVSVGLDGDQVEEFKSLVEDLSYDHGRADVLRTQLTEARNRAFPDPRTVGYVDVIARTVRR